MNEIIGLILLSLVFSLMFWYRGTVIPGAISFISWYATAAYWLASETGLPPLALLFFAIGTVNFILTAHSVLLLLRGRQEPEPLM